MTRKQMADLGIEMTDDRPKPEPQPHSPGPPPPPPPPPHQWQP